MLDDVARHVIVVLPVVVINDVVMSARDRMRAAKFNELFGETGGVPLLHFRQTNDFGYDQV